MFKKALFTGLIVLLGCSAVFALPNLLSFQGRVTNSAGQPFAAATYPFKFALCDVNNVAAWTNNGSQLNGTGEPTAGVGVAVDANGLYSVFLGDTGMTALPVGLFSGNTDLYVRVWFNSGSGFQELTPKQRIVPVAYAHYAPGGSGGGSAWMESGGNVYRASGNVGIGTNTPLAMLDVRGNVSIKTTSHAGLTIDSGPASFGSVNFYQQGLLKWGIGRDQSNLFYIGQGNGQSPNFVIQPYGTIGIGCTSVAANDTLSGSPSVFLSGNTLLGETGMRIHFNKKAHVGVLDFVVDYDNPLVASEFRIRSSDIGGAGDVDLFKLKLQSGDLWILGGITAAGNDVAEPFDLTGKEHIEMGDVVIIDPANPLHIKKSDKSYDRSVAGIISSQEQAGYIAGSRTDGTSDKPVALVGRVQCKVTTENGPIRIGDLLTTSPTPGHAMRVSDDNYLKAVGAILGKALEPFDGDKGQIMVLVTLQ